MNVVRDIAQVVQISSDQHAPQWNEVTVSFVFDVNRSPSVLTNSRSFVSFLQDEIATDNRERYFIFVDFRQFVFVVVVTVGKLVELHFFVVDVLHDRLLEETQLVRGQRVSFGYDRYNVHSVVKTFHELDVQSLKTVTSRRQKVETTVNPIVDDVSFADDTRLAIEIFFVLRIDVVDDRLPTVGVVDRVAESGSIDYGQSKLNAFFFENDRRRVDRDGFLLSMNR